MILYFLQQIVLQLHDAREELKLATGVEVPYLGTYSFQEKVGKFFIGLIKDNIPAGSSEEGFLIHKKYPASLLMSYLYTESVQFKLTLDNLGEIYQQNHWMELNLRRQPLSLLTSAQSVENISSAHY